MAGLVGKTIIFSQSLFICSNRIYGNEVVRVKNKFFTRQVCAAGSTNIGTLAARKGGSQHEYDYGWSAGKADGR